MSRSRKKYAIRKDRGISTHEYWSTIRQEWKRTVKVNWYDEDMHLRNPKEIRNDWDYCDWVYRTPKIKPAWRWFFNHTDEEWEEIYKEALRK
tara:strand:- start:3681 stop:3956 length:276 start_codon:yes stop_codon:yes gene_type:complete